jgi:catechol 2,3-dioxygenase-like lactoylglutathione lyase family enzyme
LASAGKVNVGIGHVSLEVSNIVKARRFYETALKTVGFRVVLEDKDAIGLANERCSIWLATPQPRRVQKQPPDSNDFVVADHFAILVPDRQAVDKIVEALGVEGFKPLFPAESHPEFQPGYYSASYCDDDNNVVEFYTV